MWDGLDGGLIVFGIMVVAAVIIIALGLHYVPNLTKSLLALGVFGCAFGMMAKRNFG